MEFIIITFVSFGFRHPVQRGVHVKGKSEAFFFFFFSLVGLRLRAGRSHRKAGLGRGLQSGRI